jgi:hypothetical protein
MAQPLNIPSLVSARLRKNQFLAQVRQEQLQALPIDGGKQEKDACPGVRFDSGIQPKPFILLLHNPGRTKAFGTPASTEPRFQAKASFIESDQMLDVQRFHRLWKVF